MRMRATSPCSPNTCPRKTFTEATDPVMMIDPPSLTLRIGSCGSGVDGSGPGAHRRLGGPRQCLRVDILPDVRQFAISNGNGENPIIANPSVFVASCVSFQLRPLCSTGITRLPCPYGPLRHPMRPGLTLTRCQLVTTTTTTRVSRVAAGPLCLHAVTLTPAGLMEPIRSYYSISFGLPQLHGGSAPAFIVSRPAQPCWVRQWRRWDVDRA